jgi:hypothetical protein
MIFKKKHSGCKDFMMKHWKTVAKSNSSVFCDAD